MRFTEATTSVCGPHDDLVLDFSLSTSFDWQVELAVVIGRPGRAISRAAALSHVHSCTVLNDSSARDVQMRHGGQWFKGKSVDRSSPFGPWLVTADETVDPQDLDDVCHVNGIEKQRANTGTAAGTSPN